jgi:hypothetical protein
MFMLKSKVFLYSVLVFFILLISFSVFYLYERNKNNTEEKTLEEDASFLIKKAIIKELEKRAKDNPISAEQRNRAIEEFNLKNSKNKPISNEEKIKIINSLKNI